MDWSVDWTFGGTIPAPVLVVVGGLALWWGGDKLVENAAGVARALRVPDHVVGAVVLGFGTSLPELLVCLSAAFSGNPGMAMGNVVGSNIANIGLILGLAALLAPVLVGRKLRVVDLPLGLAAGAALYLVLRPDGGQVSRPVSAALLAAFAAYLFLALRSAQTARRDSAPAADAGDGRPRIGGMVAWLCVGLACVAIAAPIFVAGAEGVADALGVPSEVVGLSVVALGTSLPELVTTVAAARRGHPELAIGNVAGSNVFNILFVLGSTAMVRPVTVSADMTADLLVMCGFAVLAFPFLSRQRHRMGRTQGIVLVALYLAYIGWIFLSGRTA